MFLIVLALIVTGAAQVAGTLLELSLAITPAAATSGTSRQHHYESEHARPAGRAYPRHAPEATATATPPDGAPPRIL